MAEVLKIKPPRRERKPSDEMDENGEPYDNIPGASYPPEFELGESLAIGAATGGQGNLVRSVIEKGAKSAANRAIANKAKDAYGERVTTVAQDARSNASSALQKVKANQPTSEAVRAEAISNPTFNEALGKDRTGAIEGLRAKNTESLVASKTLKNTKELGSDLPEDTSGLSYLERLTSGTSSTKPKSKAVETDYVTAAKQKPLAESMIEGPDSQVLTYDKSGFKSSSWDGRKKPPRKQ